jgi:hypothetical protein
MFRNSQGTRIRAKEMEPVFFNQLEKVRSTCPELIPSLDDVVENYGIHKSFHQGSTSEATNQGLPPYDAPRCIPHLEKIHTHWETKA